MSLGQFCHCHRESDKMMNFVILEQLWILLDLRIIVSNIISFTKSQNIWINLPPQNKTDMLQHISDLKSSIKKYFELKMSCWVHFGFPRILTLKNKNVIKSRSICNLTSEQRQPCSCLCGHGVKYITALISHIQILLQIVEEKTFISEKVLIASMKIGLLDFRFQRDSSKDYLVEICLLTRRPN